MVLIDAVVLAGGRSTRLGAVPKARLRYQGATLLERTVGAVAELRTVVVGDTTGQTLPADVLVRRDDPPFGGPAAAIAAGLDALLDAGGAPSEFTFALACDMPGVAEAIPLLSAGLTDLAGDADGVIASDDVIARDGRHRLQPLLAVYRTRALTRAVADRRRVGPLAGLSMFRLIAGLQLHEVFVPERAAADVDTWSDAEEWGIAPPASLGPHHPARTTAPAPPTSTIPPTTPHRSSHDERS